MTQPKRLSRAGIELNKGRQIYRQSVSLGGDSGRKILKGIYLLPQQVTSKTGR